MFKNITVNSKVLKYPPKEIYYGVLQTPDYGQTYTAYYLEKSQLNICHFKFALKQTLEEFANDLQKLWPTSVSVRNDDLTEKLFAKYIIKQKENQEVNVVLNGSDFQLKVWSALLKIPFGEERTYGEVAAMIGNPKAARAVGNAVGSNNIAIFIPCHRVKASINDVYKYGAGSELKKKILLNEQKRK
ncbi:O-6-alkylguanine-DNA alkyltransferase [Cochliomyia hominivorax]